MQYIENEKMYQAFIAGAKEVMDHRQLLNQINVFPVPDRDTGNNLYSMMQTIITRSEKKHSLKDTLASIAESAIVGARGNSGVIFSQYIQGLCHQDEDMSRFTRDRFIVAAEKGVFYAYNAVEAPVEGTMLTTMRVFYEALHKLNDYKIPFIELIERAYEQVEASVAQTTEQLINLKKAAVVDSGAKGFALFIRGFLMGLKGRTTTLEAIGHLEGLEDAMRHMETVPFEPPQYRYCTEALTYGLPKDQMPLVNHLKTYGDALVISNGAHYARVHIHTNEPWTFFRALSKACELKEQKVEDMLFQYNHAFNRKYKTVIVTDSIADLPQDVIDEGQVVVLPLEIAIGDLRFIDGLGVENTTLFELAKETGLHPTSSQPTLETCQRVLAQLLEHYEDVFVLTVSKAMSGTFNALSKAAESYKDRVQILDSKQNSVAEGLLVMEAISLLKAGQNAQGLKAHLSDIIARTTLFVSVKNLDAMIASGRLNSRLGSVIKHVGLYPIITINPEGIGVVKRLVWGSRNLKRQILKLVKTIHAHDPIQSFAMTYVDDAAEAVQMANEIEEAIGVSCAYLVPCSSVIAAGAGESAYAIGIIRERKTSV